MGGSGKSLGGHWGSKIEIFRAFITISIKNRILRHLGMLWGWFWEGFGRVWGRFWEGFGRVGDGFWEGWDPQFWPGGMRGAIESAASR